MKNGVVMETERLRLRAWRDGDDALLKLHTDTPSFKRWLEDDDMAPRRPGSTTERLQRMQAQKASASGSSKDARMMHFWGIAA